MTRTDCMKILEDVGRCDEIDGRPVGHYLVLGGGKDDRWQLDLKRTRFQDSYFTLQGKDRPEIEKPFMLFHVPYESVRLIAHDTQSLLTEIYVDRCRVV